MTENQVIEVIVGQPVCTANSVLQSNQLVRWKAMHLIYLMLLLFLDHQWSNHYSCLRSLLVHQSHAIYGHYKDTNVIYHTPLLALYTYSESIEISVPSKVCMVASPLSLPLVPLTTSYHESNSTSLYMNSDTSVTHKSPNGKTRKIFFFSQYKMIKNFNSHLDLKLNVISTLISDTVSCFDYHRHTSCSILLY